ncbi:hypothetical protein BK054_10410 [Myroides sp. ZB35]|nr:hypothetical protein BK054_10410 [Myroides sp. ZB35]
MSFFNTLGPRRITTLTQDLYEGFLIDTDEEHNHLWIYFTEIANLINTKKKKSKISSRMKIIK